MNDFYEIMLASGLAYDLMNDGMTADEIDELADEADGYTLADMLK